MTEKPAHAEDRVGAWTQQHSPWTVEGEIDGFARFATGVRRHPSKARKLVAYFLVAVFTLPILAGVVNLTEMVLGR